MINVQLPDESITQWHITWHPPHIANQNAPINGGMTGEIAGGCCDFYRTDYIRNGSSGRVHRIELWEHSDFPNYSVDVYVV